MKTKVEAVEHVSSLVEIPCGTHGKVVHLGTGDNAKLHKLMVMGLLPGVSIRLMQRFPSYLLRVGLAQVTLDKDMAREVYVST